MIFLTNSPYASLKNEPLTGNHSPDPVLYIDALMDLCVAYDDGPSHVSRRLVRVHSFVRSIHKAEAGDAPMGTHLLFNQRSNGENSAGFSVSSFCF